MEALLSARTSALCFNKDDFMVKDFSVDKFVSNCRKFVSLETMLDDLGVYHKILCAAMCELINKDYADFVNLSSNLVGLDKSIKILSLPLEKLKAEVQDLKENLDQMLNTAKTQFSNYSTAHKMKILAHHALCVLEGLEKIQNLNSLSLTADEIPSDVYERMALDFNIVEFHMSKIANLKNMESKKVIIEEVADSLMHHLEQLFLMSVSRNDTQCLYKVLRIYAVIDKKMELEKFFSLTVVKPYMECHITEENIQKFGLSKVYDNVLNFIKSSTVCAILEATIGTKKSAEIVPGYDFLVNSVWPEIVHSFELIAPMHVYAHGNPQLFHTNYTLTIVFLDRFEQYCQVEASVRRLRKHESYKSFLNKWNLDVYFQIRFSEIAGKLERSLIEGFIFQKNEEIEKKGKSNTYLLNASCTLSKCVGLCYDENVFLKPLSHSFFRLNLQLISRFYKAACTYLKCDNEDKSVNPVEAAAVIKDVELLMAELTKFFDQKICLKVPRNIVEGAFQESVTLLKDIIPLASSLMIKSLTKQCCVHLKLISDIPRLYRKTNREVPSKPSSYVTLVFSNLTNFIKETESILPAQSKKFCLREVTNGIIIQCVFMVKDVLTSIKKMEDSLKILKRARDKGGSTGGMSDDDKIRRQLIIDVNTVEQKARDLGLDIDSLKSFKELKDLMNSTEKILPQNYS